jgi:hypothetical protein
VLAELPEIIFCKPIYINSPPSVKRKSEGRRLDNSWGIVDAEGKRVFKKKPRNDLEQILEIIRLFQADLLGGWSRR